VTSQTHTQKSKFVLIITEARKNILGLYNRKLFFKIFIYSCMYYWKHDLFYTIYTF